MTTSEFTGIFNTYRMFVFFFCRKRGFSKEDSEDITSQVFVYLWKSQANIAHEAVKYYLIKAAKSKCADLIKYKNHRIQIVDRPIADDAIEDIEDIDQELEILAQVYAVIESLSPLQKKYIIMKYMEGKEPGKIAKILNRSPSTISNHLVYALSKIRKELKNRGITLG
jgi:RNA polymerase sigma factor (sigma-70 family)